MSNVESSKSAAGSSEKGPAAGASKQSQGAAEPETAAPKAKQQQKLLLPIPKLAAATPTSVTVTWTEIPGAATYAAQMTTDPSKEASWKLLSTTLKSCAVRKKNLSPGTAYFFRVRAVSEAGEWASEWGQPSPAVHTALGVNPIFRNLLGSQVLQNVKGKPGKAPAVDLNELGGGLVALYFSASWCPPCRQFTPQLVAFHEAVRRAGGPGKFEVVFVSSDQDKASFEEYFANHHGSWFALPFEAQQQRQQCGSYFKVEGIPRLIVFGPDGKIVCSNAVGERLDMTTLARWQAQAGAAPKR